MSATPDPSPDRLPGTLRLLRDRARIRERVRAGEADRTDTARRDDERNLLAEHPCEMACDVDRVTLSFPGSAADTAVRRETLDRLHAQWVGLRPMSGTGAAFREMPRRTSCPPIA